MITKPITIINCPTRREARPYPNQWSTSYLAINAASNPSDFDVAGRVDYGINAGDQGNNEINGGPSSMDAAENFGWADPRSMTGVCFQRSTISIGKLEDGTSKTYLIGEKYLDPNHYTTGMDPADNETWCTGYNNDNYRIANLNLPPQRDTIGFRNTQGFGSAHQSTWNMAYCDGHVEGMSYTIDKPAHMAAANRGDGSVLLTPE